MNLTTVRIQDLMTSDLIAVSPTTKVHDAVKEMIECRLSSLPIVDDQHRLTGFFSEKDAIAWLESRFGNQLIPRTEATVIAGPPRPVVHSGTSIVRAMTTLLKHRASCCPVVDSDGRVIGAFSEISAIRAFIAVVWDQVPTTNVDSWIDDDHRRLVSRFADLEQVIRVFGPNPFRRLFVLNDGFPVGLIKRTDVLHALADAHPSLRLNSTVIGEIPHTEAPMDAAVSPYADATSVIHSFGRFGLRRIPVIHEGRLVGQVSRCDMLRVLEIYFPEESSATNEIPSAD